MTSALFRTLLRQRLESVLRSNLTAGKAFGKRKPIEEFSGSTLCQRSLELAQKYCEAPPSGVVLLLLPHSLELFLLQLGLVLLGRVPAVLAWPTNRIDPEKYQRNILHQLQNLPAATVERYPEFTKSWPRFAICCHSLLDHRLPVV